MRLSLVPKEREYFRLFSEMAANLEKAAELLVELMDDFANAKSNTRQILEHEHVGDKIVHDIVQRLNTTLRHAPRPRRHLRPRVHHRRDPRQHRGGRRRDDPLQGRRAAAAVRASRPTSSPRRPQCCAQGIDKLEKRPQGPARLLDRGQPARERRRPHRPRRRRRALRRRHEVHRHHQVEGRLRRPSRRRSTTASTCANILESIVLKNT